MSNNGTGKNRFSLFVTHIDLSLLILTSLFAFTVSAFTSHIPETNSHAAAFDLSGFLKDGLLLNLFTFVAAEMVRIINSMIRVQKSISINTEVTSSAILKYDMHNIFINKLVNIINHENSLVRVVIPQSTADFFNTIKIERDHVEVDSDYFGMRVYINFLSTVRTSQVSSASKIRTIRATHSASLDVWKDGDNKDEIDIIHSEFAAAHGEFFRILIRNTGSRASYQEYAAKMHAMRATGVIVFFFDNSGRDGVFHDYLIYENSESYYVMKWKWDNTQDSVAFGSIKGSDLFIGNKRYKQEALRWNSLVNMLIDNSNSSTPQNYPILLEKPTNDQKNKMLIILS